MLAAWICVVAVLATLAIVGRVKNRPWLHYLCKPLTMLVIIGGALVVPTSMSSTGHVLLMMALCLSLAGDVALMLSGGFLVGLVAFLLAHVAYLACFALELPWHPADVGFVMPPLAAAVVVVRPIWNRLGRLRPAVAVYVLALVLVAFRLLARLGAWDQVGIASAAIGAAGGFFFVTGDALLAWRRFLRPAAPYAVELGSYFAAQLCIVIATFR